jgi:hypothetical protein
MKKIILIILAILICSCGIEKSIEVPSADDSAGTKGPKGDPGQDGIDGENGLSIYRAVICRRPIDEHGLTEMTYRAYQYDNGDILVQCGIRDNKLSYTGSVFYLLEENSEKYPCSITYDSDGDGLNGGRFEFTIQGSLNNAILISYYFNTGTDSSSQYFYFNSSQEDCRTITR